MANGRASITINSDTLTPALQGMSSRVHNRIVAATKRQSLLTQNYARRNAPWTDRTGNARNGLFTIAASDQRTHRIILFHSVPYGVFLEIRWSGRNEIIRPSIQAGGEQFMKTLGRLFADD